MHVAAALIAALRSAGVRHLFGNPGTTELPFLDALDGSELHYVVGLQEASVVAAADGYAQATGEVGVANVHVAPGLANALSILHNAARSRSPVLLTAGQQDTRLLVHEPILAGDLVRMAEPFTKWAYEIRSADEALPVLQRALTIALTPPMGPVFVSLPMDLMTEEVDAPPVRSPDALFAPPWVFQVRPTSRERAACWRVLARPRSSPATVSVVLPTASRR